jgi:hypothetical protein
MKFQKGDVVKGINGTNSNFPMFDIKPNKIYIVSDAVMISDTDAVQLIGLGEFYYSSDRFELVTRSKLGRLFYKD